MNTEYDIVLSNNDIIDTIDFLIEYEKALEKQAKLEKALEKQALVTYEPLYNGSYV